jgi:hypothetical protein
MRLFQISYPFCQVESHIDRSLRTFTPCSQTDPRSLLGLAPLPNSHPPQTLPSPSSPAPFKAKSSPLRLPTSSSCPGLLRARLAGQKTTSEPSPSLLSRARILQLVRHMSFPVLFFVRANHRQSCCSLLWFGFAATFTLAGVPKGQEKEVESNLHAFYLRGFVLSLGLPSHFPLSLFSALFTLPSFTDRLPASADISSPLCPSLLSTLYSLVSPLGPCYFPHSHPSRFISMGLVNPSSVSTTTSNSSFGTATTRTTPNPTIPSSLSSSTKKAKRANKPKKPSSAAKGGGAGVPWAGIAMVGGLTAVLGGIVFSSLRD